MVTPATRKMTIIAQDPSVRGSNKKILRAQISIPYEQLGPGPRGYRVHVVDYDSSQRVLYRPFEPEDDTDKFAKASDKELCNDPAFHAQNVYAIVMRLLREFETALGRRVSWSFGGHQIHIVPHAFADANAFYSDDLQGMFFGYFPGTNGKAVFTCLSHDVIAHEATHALLDGLRESYILPSHPDQAGFHEGFADIVALLSVFGLPGVVRTVLTGRSARKNVGKDRLKVDSLRKSVLMGLAEQFGKEASSHRDDCLRRAVARPPKEDALQDLDYSECHIRGEILSAAVLNSFIHVWKERLKWVPSGNAPVPVERVVEDGCDAAKHLLTMCIRALDYCPVVDITFGDFLSALLTADHRVLADDGKYKYRSVLREQFGRWHIRPTSGTGDQVINGVVTEPGIWEKPPTNIRLSYQHVHRESLEQSHDEVFRLIWENRARLGVFEHAYTRVISVRPCVRVAPDGFVLKETVSEYRQTLDVTAGELAKVCDGVKKPKDMPDETHVCLRGGGVLIFDDFGHLKYHVRSRIDNPKRQSARLAYLWRNGICDSRGRYGFSDGSARGQRFALMHTRRDGLDIPGEWNG